MKITAYVEGDVKTTDKGIHFLANNFEMSWNKISVKEAQLLRERLMETYAMALWEDSGGIAEHPYTQILVMIEDHRSNDMLGALLYELEQSPHNTALFLTADGENRARITILPTAGGMQYAFHELNFSGQAGSGFYAHDRDDILALAFKQRRQYNDSSYKFKNKGAAFDWVLENHDDPSATHRLSEMLAGVLSPAARDFLFPREPE